MQSKLTTKDAGDAAEGLYLLPLSLVCGRYFHHWDRVAVVTDADGIHHGFVGCRRPSLYCVMSVYESFGVWVFIHGGCSDKLFKPDSYLCGRMS